MKSIGQLFALLLVALPVFSTCGESFTIYAPSRVSKSLLIVKAEVSGDTIQLTKQPAIDLGFAATTITQHPDKPLLYISTNRGPEGDCPGAIVRINAGNNKITSINLKHGYSYLSLDRSSRFLLGCNYGDGYVDVYSLDENGRVEGHVAGLNEGRKNAHCVLPSPDNSYVYIPYVKDTNGLLQYSFDAKTGALKNLKPHNANPPEGTGPRHMAYHPTLPKVYFSNEQGLGVSVYEKQADGQLKIAQVCEAVKDGFDKEGVSSSDIVITPDGKYLFAGIRGHKKDFDRISRYRILEDGKVELPGLTEADAIPWGLTLSPDARFLIVTAFKGATVSAYRISENGDLTRAATLEWDQNISDVVCR